jgi:hypothetical protein
VQESDMTGEGALEDPGVEADRVRREEARQRSEAEPEQKGERRRGGEDEAKDEVEVERGGDADHLFGAPDEQRLNG